MNGGGGHPKRGLKDLRGIIIALSLKILLSIKCDHVFYDEVAAIFNELLKQKIACLTLYMADRMQNGSERISEAFL